MYRLSRLAAMPWAVMSRLDDVATQGVAAHFRKANSQVFDQLVEAENQRLLERDTHDAKVLGRGIQVAFQRGLLSNADAKMGSTVRFDTCALSAQDICDVVLKTTSVARTLGDASSGCLITLDGLSGTGKGTLSKKVCERWNTLTPLKDGQQACHVYSNGDVFRCLALMFHHEVEEAAVVRKAAPDIRDPATIQRLMSRLSLKDGGIWLDTSVYPSIGFSCLSLEAIRETMLKEAHIGALVPVMAENSQGEVILFAKHLVQAAMSRSETVIVEGRTETLQFFDTPFRFSLFAARPGMLGERRAAQRVMHEAMRLLMAQRDGDSIAGSEFIPDDVVDIALQKAVVQVK